MQDEKIAESWPVYGHEAATQFLRRLIEPNSVEPSPPIARLSNNQAQKHTNRLRHAYLFFGMRQVGKSTLARAFAQALLCTAPDRLCGQCRGCQLVLRGNHPDFRLIQPLDKAGVVDRIGGTLRVEQAAEIIRDVALRPMEGEYKVFLIQDLHTANVSFANKLLKTLEEPPNHAIFLITGLDRNRLLPTIVSRCQLLELRPLPPTTIATALRQQWQVDRAEAELLSRLAHGRLGWAVQQLDATEQQEARLAQLQTLWRLLEAQPDERLQVAEKLARNTGSQQLFELLETWTTWWRDVMLTQANALEACCNVDQMHELARQARLVPPQLVQRYLHTLTKLEGYFHHTVNTRLALEVLLLKLPQIRPN